MTTMIEGQAVETVTTFTVPVSVLRDLALAAVAAGKDDTLPTITGVFMEWNEHGLRAVATDRYRLAVVEYHPWNTPDNVRWPCTVEGSALVPAKELTAYVKTLPKPRVRDRWEPTVVIAPGEGDITFTCVHDGGELSRTIRTLDGAFPKYRSLMPDTFTGGDGDGICMDPKYLSDLAKMPDTGKAGARLRQNEANRPMMWDAGEPDRDRITWRYLLMPIRRQS
jgi:DNA polymerase III subunit beta